MYNADRSKCFLLCSKMLSIWCQNRPYKFIESLPNSMNLLFVDGILCASHTKKSEKRWFLLPTSSHVGSAAILFVDNMWNVAQLRITAQLEISIYRLCVLDLKLGQILDWVLSWFFNELRYFFRNFLGHVHEIHLGISEFDITIAFSLYSEQSK